MCRRILGVTMGAALLLSSASALGQGITTVVPEGEIKPVEMKDRRGVDGALSIGANVNFVSNSNVVGQVDGYSTLLGLSLLGGLDYVHGMQEWRNTLRVSESWARTPVIDEFVKNNDVIELESIYNYFFNPFFGAFARLNVDTALFATEAVTAEETDYLVRRADGTEVRRFTDRLELADPFEPLTFAESIGVFVEPVRSVPVNASFRLGFGARQTLAEGILVIQDVAATEVVEVTELENVFQAGLEGFAGVRGRFAENRLRYEVGGAVLIPFLNNDPEDRDALELMRIGLMGQVSTSIFSWMSLNYQVRMTSDPQLIDELQVQNSLLLTFQFDIVERNRGEAPPTTEELLREAQAKLEAAEKECAEAMEGARAAQQRALDAEVEAREAREKAAEEEAKRIAAEEAARQAAEEEAEQAPEEEAEE